MAHIVAGNVDFVLALNILIGSVPGVWLGSHWSVRVEPAVLRATLALVLIGAGLALLIKAGLGIPTWVLVPVPARRGGLLVVTMVRRRRRAREARAAAGPPPRARAGDPRCWTGRAMMVVMTPEATPAQIDAVVSRARGAAACTRRSCRAS